MIFIRIVLLIFLPLLVLLEMGMIIAIIDYINRKYDEHDKDLD